jgi:hypothetical protein
MKVIRATLAGTLAIALLYSTLVASTVLARENGGGTRSDGAGTRSPGTQTERIHLYGYEGSHCIRVVSAGVRTRHNITPGAFGASGTITLPPGPAAGNVVWAGLYWDILADTPPINAVTLNGVPVVPVPLPLSASPCWLETTAFPYVADVTGMVVAGANFVAGLDDSGAFNVSPESEGASLVVIYEDPTSTACEIIVLDGNDLLSTSGQVIDNVLPVSCPPGMPALLTFIGGDGQTAPSYDFTDNQLWNGFPLGDGDDFDASDPPAPLATPDLAWDTDTWGVAAVPPYIASLNTGTETPTYDCINWIATVLEVGVQNCQPTPTESRSWGQLKSLFR